LIARWISTDLTNFQTYAAWQLQQFGSTNALGTGELEDYDNDSAKNYLEYLTGTDPLSPASGWGLAAAPSNGAAIISWTQPANRAVELQQSFDPLPAANWTPVSAAFNQPFYPASNRVQQLIISTNTADPIFFRARVSEP
jgi:hypothetical protein